jgi:hypothetical protein
MENAPTLNHFLSIKDLSKKQLSEIVRSKEFKPVKDKMAKQLKGIPIPEKFFEEIFKQLGELLHIDVRAILLSVWAKSEEFGKFLNTEDYPPGEIALVPLAEHTITSEHSPSLKSFINKIPLGEMKFHVDIELALKGVILKIQDGKIMGGAIGSCAGKGSITYGDDHVLMQKESEPWELPGSIDLSDGIPIQEQLHDFQAILSKIINITGTN